MRTTLRVILTVVAVCGGSIHGQSPRAVTVPDTTYQEFMKLVPDVRAKRFVDLSPEDKALIMRTHAAEWLKKNRSRLSSGQVDLVQRAVEFMTPALYRMPHDPEIVKKSKELQSEFRCRVRHSDIVEAFDPIGAPASVSLLDDLWAWFEGCLFG